MFIKIFYGMGVIFAAIIFVAATIFFSGQAWWSFALGLAISLFLTAVFQVKFLKMISLFGAVIMLGLSLMKYAVMSDNLGMAFQSFYLSLGIIGLILYLIILPIFISDRDRRNDLLKRQFSFCFTVIILYSIIGFGIKGLMWLFSDNDWKSVGMLYMAIPYKWIGLLLIAQFVYKANKQQNMQQED